MRRTIAGLGRTLVTLGLLILLFVAYQLWGTGIFTARAQNELEDEFEQLRKTFATTTTSSPGPSTTAPPTSAAPVELPPIAGGDALGRLVIPAAGVDEIFVQGTNRDDLKKGPGHYPATPFPGQVGNAAIAGHRTTYGAPFFDLDKLHARTGDQRGDYIVTDTLLGVHVFEVVETRTVRPGDIWVASNLVSADMLANRGGLEIDPETAYLTLTTCNPKYSARERLVVFAQLVTPGDAPDAAAPDGDAAVTDVDVPGGQPTDGPTSLAEGLSGDPTSRRPTLLWGIAAGIVGLWWWWAFRRWRHPFTWLAGLPPFMSVLFVFYVYLERVLPAGY